MFIATIPKQGLTEPLCKSVLVMQRGIPAQVSLCSYPVVKKKGEYLMENQEGDCTFVYTSFTHHVQNAENQGVHGRE